MLENAPLADKGARCRIIVADEVEISELGL